MALPFSRPAWYSDAACKGFGPTYFFRPDSGDKGAPRRWPAQNTALALCEQCAVAYDCLSEALDRGERFGIWGGFDLRHELGAARHAHKQKGAA